MIGKFNNIIRSIKQILLKKDYIKNLNIKITNLDDYFKKLEKEQNESISYFNKKIDKLYAYIYDELIKKYSVK